MKSHLKNSPPIPAPLAPLGRIRDITPRDVQAIQQQLGVNSIKDVITAIINGRLETVEGLKPAQIKNIRRAFKLNKTADSRVPLWDARLAGEELLRALCQFPEVEKATLTGSLRRSKDTIGDIDILLQLSEADHRKLLYKIARMAQTERIIATGPHHICLILRNQLQADIRLATRKYFGASLLYYTGSTQYGDSLKSMAAQKGFRLGPLGLVDMQTGEYVAGEQETDIYHQLGIGYLEPELREDHQSMAALQSIPPLVSFSQLKGDMQIHTNWSDGTESIAGIARYLSHTFPHYQYIVITDHVSAKRPNHVLPPADVFRQAAEIDRINDQMGFGYIKKGVETDILENGEPELAPEVLQQFDWVIASIHTDFTRDNTDRLIKACENPYVHCIGHPSGRMIGMRPPYPADWNAVFDAAARTGTALEINSRPNRLDLNDELVRKAVRKGVKLVINSDARTLSHFDFVKLGVSMARRGACSKKDILNTGSWEDIEAFKAAKQQLLRS
ncbi:DNA polymerase/3'-5' exonuclease PolX [Chitinophaga varians]|uniref:DNA polymerase/3'-5' exonuclease PolX n=1 Tax=Chitinophaga varians TaxID=2202339 RepID=A0A847RHL8_9BACT|nr:DNA polymerase/3'-5' exonuclease PolX [Chitinophaga varians]NLR62706.1 DNA polymerase/3'-5' exonuclease PolX [Chitinophaga varians]